LKVLVTNYYDPFPASVSSSCVDTAGYGLTVDYPFIGLTGNELTWLKNDLIDLNSSIANEVAYANTNYTNLDVYLVDISGAMAGHEFCTSSPWVFGPSIRFPAGGAGPSESPAPFHPTQDGQRAIYEEVKATLS
jgi:hypothetical protein